jgi:acyl-CoA reductase-like NAD-dependent aldehyde dehydrogenase
MIEGESSSGVTARELKTINPATEEVKSTYKIMTKEQINEKVTSTKNACGQCIGDMEISGEVPLL